jgi:serine/threonine-protein kinase
MSADRNLLFGVLALQADLLDAARFAEACSAWAARKDTPLPDLLVERGWLTEEERGHVEFLLQRKLKKHNGDARASLAEVRHSLASVADPDLQQSLAALPTPDLSPPGSTTADEPQGRGRYTLTRLHATGGIGQVWLAHDDDLGRDVALKELRPERQDHPAARARFLEEARVTGQLEHPGIVPVHELVRPADGQPFYTMRLVRGRTLAEAIKDYHRKRQAAEAGPLDLHSLLRAFVAVCQAVAYAHSRKVLHRDLKPSNVVLGDYGEVMVLDWGLARLMERNGPPAAEPTSLLPVSLEAGSRDETVQGQVLGTPAYMAPEQAEGRLDLLGPATDVYALGAVLYELLTAEPPFVGPSDEVLRRVVREEPGRPRLRVPATPRGLEAVCLKALAKKPRERYPSARELAQEVERWLADEPVLAWREPWRARAGRFVRRHQPLVAALAAGLLAVLLLGGGGALWLGREQERRRAAAESALEEVERLQRQARWAEARAALDRAEARLGESGPATLRERLGRARADLELVARLDAIPLERAILKGRQFDHAGADRKYAEAFAEAGLGEAGDDEEVVARRVADSPVREALVAALDGWAEVVGQEGRRAWLLAVARRADPHPWRDRLRQPALWRNEAKLARLVGQAPPEALTPALAAALGGRLAKRAEGEALLRSAQQGRPGDFWLNYYLAYALGRGGKTQEAEGYSRAALALRPDSSAAYYNLGLLLHRQGKVAEAEKHYRQAIDTNPRNAPAHNNLGPLLEGQGKLAEAEKHYRRAITLDPRLAQPHTNLGWVLERQGKLAEAEKLYRRAITLDPRLAQAHTHLGWVLERQGKLAEALAQYRKVLALDPGHAGALKRLPLVERLAAIEPKLPAFLKGDFRPHGNDERLALAELCLSKRLYRAFAGLHAEAIAADPKLADDLKAAYRYNAACAAALAAAGKGEDAATLDGKERLRLREQALAWLKADLALWKKQLEGGKPTDRAEVQAKMRHWQKDSDLAGVRDPSALAKLPEAERLEWQKFWKEVETLLAKAGAEKAGK